MVKDRAFPQDQQQDKAVKSRHFYSMLYRGSSQTSRQENEIKGIQSGKEDVKPPSFIDDIILYIDDPRFSSTKKTIGTNK